MLRLSHEVDTGSSRPSPRFRYKSKLLQRPFDQRRVILIRLVGTGKRTATSLSGRRQRLQYYPSSSSALLSSRHEAELTKPISDRLRPALCWLCFPSRISPAIRNRNT